MRRDVSRLSERPLDLLVVGAGIYGLMAAWDAALRGLSVGLVDAGDFGAATSFNSLKTVHGGLRSLQRAAIGELREFVRERRALFRMAPDLVRPLPFLVPTWPELTRGRLALGVAMRVYDLLAWDRNAGVREDRHLPGGRLVPAARCRELFPGLDDGRVTGGALWHDGQMTSPDRLAWRIAASAGARGAAVANYVEVTGGRFDRGRLRGVTARDLESGTDLEIAAAVVLNAAGPWADALNARIAPGRVAPTGVLWSRAMNLVTTRPAGGDHAAGRTVDGRFLFRVPWREVAMFGTSHERFEGTPADLRVTRADVERFLADLTRAFPADRLDLDAVTLVHRGLLPMTGMRNGEVQLAKASVVRDHGAEGVEGLVTLLGVRYTTARAAAEQAVDLACRRIGRETAPCATSHTRLDAASAGETSAGTPLSDASTVTREQVAACIRHEMAVRLTDAVIRRTQAGAAAHPGAAAVSAAAEVMALECGWDEERRAREIAAVDAFYRLDD